MLGTAFSKRNNPFSSDKLGCNLYDTSPRSGQHSATGKQRTWFTLGEVWSLVLPALSISSKQDRRYRPLHLKRTQPYWLAVFRHLYSTSQNSPPPPPPTHLCRHLLSLPLAHPTTTLPAGAHPPSSRTPSSPSPPSEPTSWALHTPPNLRTCANILTSFT